MTRKHDPNAILCRTCSGTGFDLTRSQRIRCETCGGSGMVKATDTVTSFVDDPQHWEMRAEEMRTLADETRDETARAIILKIAADYDSVAERVGERQGLPSAQSAPRVKPLSQSSR